MQTGVTSEGAQPRWLSPAELATWRALAILTFRLPTALEVQLRRDAGLSFVEYLVLAGLSEAPGRRMRMSELAVLANSELSRLSHLVGRLEKRGLVRREPDPTNGRYTHAILTDTGYAYLVEAAPRHVARVRELVFDVLDPATLATLRAGAEAIINHIDEDQKSG
jgi:DNA-binding MarR family transcriptional regulator